MGQSSSLPLQFQNALTDDSTQHSGMTSPDIWVSAIVEKVHPWHVVVVVVVGVVLVVVGEVHIILGHEPVL
eukprot:2716870-Karenia_brevis.AAC.1